MPEKTEQEIMTQIEAMLRLSMNKGAEQAERDNALRVAERMMTKHKIARHRLNPEAYEKVEVIQQKVWLEKSWLRQQVRVAWAIQRLFYVRCVSNTAGRSNMLLTVHGRENDIKIFLKVFDAITDHMLFRKDRSAKIQKKMGELCGRSWHYSFIRGYINELRRRADDLLDERKKMADDSVLEDAGSDSTEIAPATGFEVKAIVAIADSELEESVKKTGAKPYSVHTPISDYLGAMAGRQAGRDAPLTVQEKLAEGGS